MYEPSTKRGLILCVPDRGANTLLPIIERYMLPGTEIHSDMWAAYNNISQLPVVPPYIHRTVNHSLHFRDPVSGVHTNNVEAFWSSVKRKFKIMNGINRSVTESHLDEVMYRNRITFGNADLFISFVEHIGDLNTFE